MQNDIKCKYSKKFNVDLNLGSSIRKNPTLINSCPMAIPNSALRVVLALK
jgi:hypothetical protein